MLLLRRLALLLLWGLLVLLLHRLPLTLQVLRVNLIACFYLRRHANVVIGR